MAETALPRRTERRCERRAARTPQLATIACLFAMLVPGIAAAAPDYPRLLDLASSPSEASTLADAELRVLTESPPDGDPLWPLHTYLVGELRRARGEPVEAQERFRALLDWATDERHATPTGASGLATVALWRLLQLSDDPAVRASDFQVRSSFFYAGRLLERDARGRRGRLLEQGMFGHGVLPSVPQLEEDILARLALLAWELEEKDAAKDLAIQYAEIATAETLNPRIQEILDAVYADGTASPDRIAFRRADRMMSLNRYEEASRWLRLAEAGNDPELRSGAIWMRAKIMRRTGESYAVVISTLNRLIADEDIGPKLKQQAIYRRALLRKQAGERILMRSDLKRLIEEAPGSDLVDDALIELARDHQMANEPERAIAYFRQVRGLPAGRWKTTAAIQEAMTYYARARANPGRRASDLEAATEIFASLRESHRAGIVNALATFWSGRIAEETGQSAIARERYLEILERYPLDYYAIRARMHLNAMDAGMGPTVALAIPPAPFLWPDGPSATPAVSSPPPPDSEVHRRLAATISSGAYQSAMRWEPALRERSPEKSLEELPLRALDAGGWLPPIAVLLAARLDAIAAVRGEESPEQKIALARLVETETRDWPTAVAMVATVPSQDRSTRRFVYAAYPPAYEELLQKTSQPEESAKDMLPSLLYSVMRQESSFVPSAISRVGALGLFQLRPATLRDLASEHPIREFGGSSDARAILLDPASSIRVASVHFGQDLLPAYGKDVVLALMAHHAGKQAVNHWIESWQEMGLHDDVEFRVETARAQVTRNFVRRTLADVTVVESAGFFGD